MSDLSSFERMANLRKWVREANFRKRMLQNLHEKSYCIHTDMTELRREIKEAEKNRDHTPYSGHP